MPKSFFFIFSLLIFQYCTPGVRYVSKVDTNYSKNQSYMVGDIIKGQASFYGKKFHGRKTANGEIFNMYDKTAAHKFLPFDTILKVINLSNNKQVIVRINDRGPFVKDRILDLSFQAAKELDMITEGVTNVSIQILKIKKT
jgi:rare lipoprotein A